MTTNFGKIPFAIVEAGAIAELGRAEVACYTVLCAYCNGKTWESWPGVTAIARNAGVHPRTAEKALAQLRGRGLIEVIDVGGGRELTTRYRIIHEPRPSGVGVSDVKPRPSNAGVSRVNPGLSVPKPRPQRAETPASGGRPNREETEEQQQQQKIAAAGISRSEEADPAVLAELDIANVAEPTRSRLAAEPGITAAIVRQARVPGRGPGAIIENIRTELRRKAQVKRRAEAHDVNSASSPAARIRAEDAEIDRPDVDWIKTEAARHGLAACPAETRR